MGAYTELQDALYDSIAPIFPTLDASGAILWGNMDNLEPESSYLSMFIIEIEEQGREANTWGYDASADVIAYSTMNTYEATVQFSFRGSQSGDLVHLFKQKLNSPIFWEFLNQNNLSKMRTSQIRYLPQKRDTQWVDGFNIDVVFAYAYVTQENIDPIEQVIVVDETYENKRTYYIPENIG